jgi:hypothetical protein
MPYTDSQSNSNSTALLLLLLAVSWFAVYPAYAQTPDSAQINSSGYSIIESIELDTSATQLTDQVEIFVDFRGDLVILERTEPLIYKFAADGSLIQSIGGFGFDLGRFNRPVGLSSRDGGLNYYLLDADNYRIVRLNSKLQWIEHYELKRQYDNRSLGRLVGFAMNSYGEMYISDPVNQRILHLDRFAGIIDVIEIKMSDKSGSSPAEIKTDKRDFIYLFLRSDDDDGFNILLFDNLGNKILRKAEGYKHFSSDNKLLAIIPDDCEKAGIYDTDFEMVLPVHDLTEEYCKQIDAIHLTEDGSLVVLNSQTGRIVIYGPMEK